VPARIDDAKRWFLEFFLIEGLFDEWAHFQSWPLSSKSVERRCLISFVDVLLSLDVINYKYKLSYNLQ